MSKADRRFATAVQHWEAGAIKKALALFDAIIDDQALSPSARAIVCEYVGRVQIGIGELQTAEVYLQRAVALNSEDVEHRVQLANCLCLQNRNDEAWEMIRDLYRHHPDHPAAVHYMGKMLDERGRHKEGLKLMKKSIRMDPTNARFYANLSFTYFVRGNLGAAMVCSEQALALNPKDGVVKFVHEIASTFEKQEASQEAHPQAVNKRMKDTSIQS